MKNLIFNSILMLLSQINYAQTITAKYQSINGLVVNQQNEPIGDVLLNLINLKTNTQLWEGISDVSGAFKLPPLELTDSISLTAYSYTYELFTMLLTKNNTTLKVVLKESSIKLNEVFVVADARPVKFEKGELIVDVRKIKNYDRLSTSQLMNRIPGLSVADNRVRLYGQMATVYINGVQQAISSDALMKYLESLPAEALANIKLIPLPSSKYGTAQAVIDITLDKNMTDGIYSNTSISSSILGDKFGGATIEEFFMFKKKNVIFNTGLEYNNSTIWTKSLNEYYLDMSKIQINSPTQIDGRKGFIRSSSNLTLLIKNKNMLDFNVFIYYDQSKKDHHWSYTENANPVKNYLGNINGNDDMYSFTAKYSTNDQEAHSFQIYYSGMYGSIKTNSDYYLQDPGNSFYKYLFTDYKMHGQQHNLSADGVSNFRNKKLQLEYGVQFDMGILKDNNNDYDGSSSLLQNSSRFKATELNARAYVRTKYNISDHQGLSLDIGYVNTLLNYNNHIGDSEERLVYHDLVPRFIYWYRTQNYRLSLRFWTYYEKPQYAYLLPGERYINNYMYTKGNPNLKNKRAYSLQVMQQFWEFLDINIYSGIVKNHIKGYYGTDENNTVYNSYENVADELYLNANIVIPFQLLNRKLYGSVQSTIYNSKFFNLNPKLELTVNHQYDFNVNYGANIFYDITDRLSLNSALSGRTKAKGFQVILSPTFLFSAGASYVFLKEKNLVFEFTASNFLGHVHDVENRIQFAGNNLEQYNYRQPRYSFKLSYRFGKGKKDIERRDNAGDFSRMKP
ncbi:MAG: outer membrane beta-barrel protein [Bacteroidales bacterium]